MLRTVLIASLVIIAPAAWAQNTIVPGQWAQDVGLARGPQSTGPDAAVGYGTNTVTCGPEA